MSIWHGEKGRKPTGGKIKPFRKKRKFELGSFPILPKIGKDLRKVHRGKGGTEKIKSHSIESVNVFDPTLKKTKKVKILGILENPANPHFVRRGIITKGTIIRTEMRRVKITSRPSQSGHVNGIVVKKE